MANPDPQKFYTAPEAFDALGRKHYGDTWTGAEITARNIPAPARPATQAERARKVQEARRASVGVGGGVRVRTRPATRYGTSTTTERLKTEYAARLAEREARRRRDEVEDNLRNLLYCGDIETKLLNGHDGELVSIPRELWLANKFSIDFASGKAGWEGSEAGQKVAYHGIALIDRSQFDSEVSVTPRPTVAGSSGDESDQRPSDQAETGNAGSTHQRKRNTKDDALVRNRIERVIATFHRRWNGPTTRPSARTMAQILLDDQKSEGFGFSTLRAIISGTYPPMTALNIRPPW